MKKTLLLIALGILALGGCSSGAPEGPTEDAQFVNQMVRKTGGDPSKLTPEERAKMDKITKGETESVLRLGSSSMLPPPPK